ncbi:hypothetical protein SAMN02910264_01279 [Ruminococcaceae bacterium YAD3003]|nr:hypothetical protein SAMN02910264_01279 [Ruminococcaceae bacterium YAD3003]
MPDVNATPISLKCKVCGGDIVNNYLGGTCVCANCGNKWAIADVIPNYEKYTRIIANIAKANEIIESDTKVASANEAKLLFKTSVMECSKLNDAVSADLIKICNDGLARAEKYAIYIKGKNFYEKQSWSSAAKELGRVPGYRDADAMVEICKEEIEKERKKQIPWAVVFSLIIPAAFGLFLREAFGCPWAVCIILFLLGSAGLGYVFYRGGVVSIILKVISFLAATPLIIYSLLAYVFHLPTVVSVIIAIVGPIVLFILFAQFTEQITKKNK